MRVTGRDDDMMIIRGVNVYPSQVEAVLVGVAGRRAALSDRADARRRARRHDRGGRDGARCAADETHRQRTAKEIVGQIKARLGVSCEVVIKASGEVPRSQGKAVRVKDLRKKV